MKSIYIGFDYSSYEFSCVSSILGKDGQLKNWDNYYQVKYE